jgi:magnesium transporter
MTELAPREPWYRLRELLESSQVESLRALLESLPPGEIARTLSRLAEEDQARLLALLGPERGADMLEILSEAQVVEIIEDLPAAQAALIVDELPSAERADLLAELPSDEAEAILQEMTPSDAAETRQLLRYPSDTAGGIMTTECLAFSERLTVADVVQDLRTYGDQYSDYEIQYTYITDANDTLVGVLRLRDLLLSRGDASVRQIMIREPLSVTVDTSLDELKRIFDRHAFLGIPVIDERGRLVGIVQRTAVEAALQERATRTFLKISGLVGEDELRTMPMFRRSFRRLSWLSINIVLNVVAASVIALYQDTLAAVIALAVFLPIISDMSGCSGNQAVAVSIRELALGLIKPYEFFRVFVKEGGVGVINGAILGVLLGALAFLWKGNVHLSAVVAGALMLNTMLSVLIGGLVPLGLKRLDLDPALASGPILTTITDVCGFFFVLSFASAMLPWLAS